MFCGKCGSKINDGVKFCPSCGAESGAAKEHVVSVENKKEKSKKKWKKKIIVVIVVVLVVLLIGLVVWLMKQMPVKEGNLVDTQQTESLESEETHKKPIMKTYEFYADGELVSKEKCDEHGRCIYWEYEGKIITFKWEYSETEEPIKCMTYDEKGELVGGQEYDEKGNLVLDWYNGHEEFERYRTMEYNQDGNILKEYYEGPYYEIYTNYEYDEDGCLNKEYIIAYDVDTKELDYESTYFYSKNGELLKSHYISYHEGERMRENHSTYDRYGNETSNKWYHSNGDLDYEKIYEYEYDEYNNVVKKHEVVYEDGIVDREYVYEYVITYDENGNILDHYEYEEGEMTYSHHYTYY